MKSGQYLSPWKNPLLYQQWVPSSLWKVSPYVRTDDLGWFLEKLPQFLAFASFKGTDSNSATVVCKYLWLSAPRQTLSSTVAHFRNAFLRSSIFNRTKCSITCFKCYDQKDSLSPAFRYSKNETAFSGREPSVLNVTYVHLSTGFLLHNKLFSFSN